MRFKKGIFINCPNAYESPKTLIAAMERAKNLGADGVQLSDMTTLDKTYAGFRKEIRTAADSMGLEICAVCGDIGVKFHDIERREGLYETMKHMYDIALSLGTKIVTTHIGVVPAERTHPRYGVMLETFGTIAEIAAPLGAYLANETGPEEAPVLKAFLDDVASPAAAVNFDPANIVMSTGEKAEEAAKILGSYIVHTHAKDGILLKKANLEVMYGVFHDPAFRESDYCKEVLIGEGDVHWTAYLNTLEAMGYNGYLTIEREGSATQEEDFAVEMRTLEQLI